MNYNTWKLVLISTASAQEKAQGTLENREDQIKRMHDLP